MDEKNEGSDPRPRIERARTCLHTAPCASKGLIWTHAGTHERLLGNDSQYVETCLLYPSSHSVHKMSNILPSFS